MAPFKENDARLSEYAFPSLLIAKWNQLICFWWQIMERTTQTALRNILVSMFLKNPIDLVSEMVYLGVLLVSAAVLFVLLYSKYQIHSQVAFSHYSKITVHFQA